MEHNQEHGTNMKDAILRKINAKELSMHPRYYFALRVAALVAVSIGVLLVSVFICNFLLFSIRVNSADSYLYFGLRGWGAFLSFFPWDLFTIDVLLVGTLLWLLRQFKFGYKSPMLYIVLGLILITVAAGAFLDRATDINDRALRAADDDRLPGLLDMFYGTARRMPPPGHGVCKCVIVSIQNGMLTLVDLRDASTTFTAVMPQDDPRATTSGLEPGDVIFVAGDRGSTTVHAFGIRKLPEEETW